MKNSFLNNIDSKNSSLKKKIIGLCINEGDYSIAELSKELNTSIPTITKLVGELIDAGFLEDMGKSGTSGGRRPSIFGLNSSAGYFVGTDVQKDHARLIDAAMMHLVQDGVMIFSCNFRRFRLDDYITDKYSVEDISEQTIGRDFERDMKIHKCYLIRHKYKITGEKRRVVRIRQKTDEENS